MLPLLPGGRSGVKSGWNRLISEIQITTKEAIMTKDNKNIGKRNNTMTKTLINNLEEVEKLWIQYGCYKAAEELSKMLNTYISFSTVRYLSQVFDWKRPVHPNSPILVGVRRGTRPGSYYSHLIFPTEVNKDDENILSRDVNR